MPLKKQPTGRIVPAPVEEAKTKNYDSASVPKNYSALTKEDIFLLCSPFINLEFFNKINFTRQQLYNGESDEQLNEFFKNIDDYFSCNCHKNPNREKLLHPLKYVYEVISQQKYGNILSLKGANGTGKSVFCNALFIYLLNSYNNNTDIIPLYFDCDGCLNNASNTDVNSWDETNNWGQPWKDSFTWSDIKNILDTFINSVENLLKQNYVVCLIIDGAYDKYILPRDIVGRALESHIKRLKSTYGKLKIIISEDTYDYFITSEFSERDWLESSDTIDFNGCEYYDYNELKSCIKRYCNLMKISDDELLLNKVLTTKPMFRLDMRLLGILSKMSDSYDIGKYYYDEVINQVNIFNLSNVARDMLVNGQISDSWDSSNKKELALLLDDEYAFYFFSAYSFVSQWKNIETNMEIFSNELFLSMVENKSISFINTKIIYFIDFLFSKEAVEQKKRMLNIANDLISFLCNEYQSLSEKLKLISLKIISIFVFIVGKIEDNQHVHNLKLKIFNTLCSFSIISSTYLYGINQEISDEQSHCLAGLLHCCHLYSIYLKSENNYILSFYLSQINSANYMYKSMLKHIISNCLTYYGGKLEDEEKNFMSAINSLFSQVQTYSTYEKYGRINIEIDLVIFTKSFEFISALISEDIKTKFKNLIKFTLRKNIFISAESKKALSEFLINMSEE